MSGFTSIISGLQELQAQSSGDPGVCIAVIDSRVDLQHPCFSGAQLDELMPVWLRSKMGPSGSSHGTHVASVMFGQPGSPLEGIAPRCRGIVIPVFGEAENGELRPCSQEDLARAISLAIEAGANLINISGGELTDAHSVDRFLTQAVRTCDRQNVLLVAATGNDGCACLHAPALLPTVLAVGASDGAGRPLSFSNWDESLNDHGVLAPGEAIPGASPGGSIAQRNGTSFASPIVAGVAALLLSLQRQRGDKLDSSAVRDAIVASATPCTPEEQAQCERTLGGRLNVAAARERLFGPTIVPSNSEIQLSSSSSEDWQAGRFQPIASAPMPGLATRERRVMTSQQNCPCMSASGFGSLAGGIAPSELEAGQPPGIAVAQLAGSAMAPSGETMPIGVPGQFAPTATSAVWPQEVMPNCGCGGRGRTQEATPQQFVPQAQQFMQPQQFAPQLQQFVPQQFVPQQFVPQQFFPQGQPGLAFAPSAELPHQGPGGIPQAPFGARPAATPAQRLSVIASGGAVPMARGVAPSETQSRVPMPTDFVTAENSQLVYAIGELGYDFITDARRDYFVQQFGDMSEDDAFISQFEADLGLAPQSRYLPEDNRAMAAYLSQGRPGTPAGRNPEDIGSLMWILIQEGQPLYALRPLHTLALAVLATFANILYDQSRPDDDAAGNPNPLQSDRVSIAGRIIGDVTLYNGQTVPVLDVSLRALFNWRLELILTDALGPPPDPQDVDLRATYDASRIVLRDFLDRVYYEVRNMGQSPTERAINYLATNVFQAKEAFVEAVRNNLVLDSIYAEKSPLCRPKSDCWDVVMRFFDPQHRLERALDEYRLTVDVNDISPVGIGKLRKWARYA